jgi:hypothetical protein
MKTRITAAIAPCVVAATFAAAAPAPASAARVAGYQTASPAPAWRAPAAHRSRWRTRTARLRIVATAARTARI